MGKLKIKAKKVFKGVLRGVLIITFLIVIASFCKWDPRIYIPVFIIIWVFYIIEKRFSKLENKIEFPADTGGIGYIMNFNFELSKPFFQKFQEKLGINNEAIVKIQNSIPRVEFKIESYTNGFARLKVWYHCEDKTRYGEDDDTSSLFDKPYIIWSVNLDEYLPEKDTFLGGSLDFVYKKGEFLLYLIGGRFGAKDRIDHSEPLEENILFRLQPTKFKELEKYHLLYNEFYRDPTFPYFYKPSNEHRIYNNESDIKTGIFWCLEWFDFTGTLLPKLEYEKGKYIVDLDSLTDE